MLFFIYLIKTIQLHAFRALCPTKDRLIAKGYSQREDIDYKETFSPASTKDSLRGIMAIVAHFDLKLHQIDVRTAFLNGDLSGDVYMIQHLGFDVARKRKHGL